MNIVLKRSFLTVLLLFGGSLYPVGFSFDSVTASISKGFNNAINTVIEHPKAAIATTCAVIGAASLYNYIYSNPSVVFGFIKKQINKKKLDQSPETSLETSANKQASPELVQLVQPQSSDELSDDELSLSSEISGSSFQNLFDETNLLDKAFEKHLFYPAIGNRNNLDFSIIDNGTHGYENSNNESIEIDGEQWLVLNEKVALQSQFKDYSFIKKLVRPSLQHKGKITFLCVHGTFSSSNKFSGDPEKENSQYLLQFANRLAEAKDMAVEVIAFKWSAKLSLQARKDAAKVLAQMLSEEIGKDSEEVWAYAHSHGCNVVSLAAQKYYQEIDPDKKFHTIIYCASPAPDFQADFEGEGFIMLDEDPSAEKLRPLAYANNVYHFYGSSDVTQALGSYESKGTWDRKLPLSSRTRIHNIRLMADADDLDHADIKHHVSKHLHELLARIDSWYPHHYDLDASVPCDDDSLPYVGIRRPEVHNQSADAEIIYECKLSELRSEEQRKSFAEKFGQDLSHNIHNTHPWTGYLWMMYKEYSSRQDGH